MTLRFANSARSTVGIEWELALIDRESGELLCSSFAVQPAHRAVRRPVLRSRRRCRGRLRQRADPAVDRFAAEDVARQWERLHAGDGEPLPRQPAVLRAWALCHEGAFGPAAEAGLLAGGDGITVANKAMVMQATTTETPKSAFGVSHLDLASLFMR